MRECRGVGQHDPHPIARLDPRPFQQRRDSRGCGVELGEGELQVVAAQSDAIGVAIFRCDEIGAQAVIVMPLQVYLMPGSRSVLRILNRPRGGLAQQCRWNNNLAASV